LPSWGYSPALPFPRLELTLLLVIFNYPPNRILEDPLATSMLSLACCFSSDLPPQTKVSLLSCFPSPSPLSFLFSLSRPSFSPNLPLPSFSLDRRCRVIGEAPKTWARPTSRSSPSSARSGASWNGRGTGSGWRGWSSWVGRKALRGGKKAVDSPAKGREVASFDGR
jgi:hypothetical protein